MAVGGEKTGRITIWLCAVAVVFVQCNWIISFILNRNLFRFIRNCYNGNTLYLPLIFISIAGYEFVRWRRNRDGKRLPFRLFLILAGVFALLGVRYYATHWEPHRLQVKRIEIVSDKVNAPLKILHVSDIQSDQVGEYDEMVFRRMRDLSPDIVLHTGDLLHPVAPATIASEKPKMAALFATLRPPGGNWTLIGDVDRWMREPGMAVLGGMKILDSRHASVKLPQGNLALYGMSVEMSDSRERFKPEVEEWLESAREGSFTILMGHAPDFALGVGDMAIDLCLAGHTHGGQIRIPFYGPIVTLSHVPRDWARGLTRIGQTVLHVSAGIGSEHASGIPDIRVNCPPEMTLITIIPEKETTDAHR